MIALMKPVLMVFVAVKLRLISLGDFTLKVMIGSNDIKDSPFHPHVEAGEPNPGSCEAFGEGLHTARAGEEAHFTVQTKVLSNSKTETKPGFRTEMARTFLAVVL